MYTVVYDSKIPDDVKSLGASEKKRIETAIDNKLKHSPLRYGKPLQHSLSGLRSMRVGDYRVVFKIAEDTILVVLIAHRSVVYKIADKRSNI